MNTQQSSRISEVDYLEGLKAQGHQLVRRGLGDDWQDIDTAIAEAKKKSTEGMAQEERRQRVRME